MQVKAGPRRQLVGLPSNDGDVAMEQSAGLLFALEGSRAHGERVASQLEWPLSPHEERAFEDGEHKIRPLIDVNGRDVFVIHSLAAGAGSSPSDRLCRLLFFIGALKDAGARRVTAVVPYLCYAAKGPAQPDKRPHHDEIRGRACSRPAAPTPSSLSMCIIARPTRMRFAFRRRISKPCQYSSNTSPPVFAARNSPWSRLTSAARSGPSGSAACLLRHWARSPMQGLSRSSEPAALSQANYLSTTCATGRSSSSTT